jgi:hypothetical protein
VICSLSCHPSPSWFNQVIVHGDVGSDTGPLFPSMGDPAERGQVSGLSFKRTWWISVFIEQDVKNSTLKMTKKDWKTNWQEKFWPQWCHAGVVREEAYELEVSLQFLVSLSPWKICQDASVYSNSVVNPEVWELPLHDGQLIIRAVSCRENYFGHSGLRYAVLWQANRTFTDSEPRVRGSRWLATREWKNELSVLISQPNKFSWGTGLMQVRILGLFLWTNITGLVCIWYLDVFVWNYITPLLITCMSHASYDYMHIFIYSYIITCKLHAKYIKCMHPRSNTCT